MIILEKHKRYGFGYGFEGETYYGSFVNIDCETIIGKVLLLMADHLGTFSFRPLESCEMI